MTNNTSILFIDERELKFEFTHSSGPGGQNVNKLSTAVQLRFHIPSSQFLSDEIKIRLIHLAGKRVTSDGVLIIEASSHRTQEGNRAEALRKFHHLLERARQAPKPRLLTKPTRASKEKRLSIKKKRGTVKQLRQTKNWE